MANWQRREWRFACTARVEVELNGKKTSVYTVNLSLGGMMLRSSAELPVNEEREFALQLEGRPQPLKVRGRVLMSSKQGADYRSNIMFIEPPFEVTEAVRDFCRDKLVPNVEKSLQTLFPAATKLVTVANEFARLQPGKEHAVDVVELGFGTKPDPQKFERAAQALRDAMLLIEQLYAAVEMSNEVRDYSPFEGEVSELAAMVRSFRAYSERQLEQLQQAVAPQPDDASASLPSIEAQMNAAAELDQRQRALDERESELQRREDSLRREQEALGDARVQLRAEAQAAAARATSQQAEIDALRAQLAQK